MASPIGNLQVKAQVNHQTCMDMGGGMITCNGTTSGGPQQEQGGDGGAALGAALGRLIFGDPEERFRREVGRMLAEGRCRDAATFAYEEGRLELGSQIAQSCNQNSRGVDSSVDQQGALDAKPTFKPGEESGVPVPIELNLEERLRFIASNVQTPVQFDDLTTITRVESIGAQLLFSAAYHTDANVLSNEERQGFVNVICADEMTPNLLAAG